MKAIVQRRYGPPQEVLTFEDVERPRPGQGEILVRVRAASMHADIWHVVTGRPRVLRLMGAGLARPRQRVPGTDVAGIVEELGPGASRFRVGDAVMGEVVQGHQWKNGGTFAEFVAAPEDELWAKPARLTMAQAGALPTAGLIAVQGIRDQGHVQPGHRVLINGAGGSVGTFAVQVAKAHDAHVTAVDLPHKLERLRAIGADEVVDATKEDFTRSPATYDLVLDVASNRPWEDVKRVVAPSGKYVLIGHDHFGARGGGWIGGIGVFAKLSFRARGDPRVPGFSIEGSRPSRMRHLIELVERGQLTPLIDRTFPIEQAVDALAYLAAARPVGKVVLVTDE